jgi:acyl-CoA reductase-like NAD-dependent aldehyde dehydrogenase
LESLTPEDLIKLVQKQLANQNEAHTHKQLEAVKKEVEENAKQQAKEMTTKMEELKRALLASQQQVEELTAEMANQNVEHQKHLDIAKQADEVYLFIGNLL